MNRKDADIDKELDLWAKVPYKGVPSKGKYFNAIHHTYGNCGYYIQGFSHQGKKYTGQFLYDRDD